MTAQPDTFQVSFGALAPHLEDQLREQGISVRTPTGGATKWVGKVQHIQQDIDAVNRLRVRGKLTHSEARKAEARIFKDIQALVTSVVSQETER